MTVVINYYSDFLSIIMTDRRISYGPNAELGFSDDHQKLINLKEMGWAAGAGLSDYLTRLKDRLSESTITSVSEIMDIYENIKTSSIEDDPDSEFDIHQSIVSFSLRQFDYETKMFKFPIGLLNEMHVHEDGITLVPPDTIHIIYPTDVYLDKKHRERIAETHEVTYKFDGIEQLMHRLLTAFLDISTISRFVSEECDLGIEILLKEGICKFKLAGNIHDLLQASNENRLNEKLELVSKITAS